MLKMCKCGHEMSIGLRTVVYFKIIEIDNVPVFTCAYCNKCEVFQAVKAELAVLISQLGQMPCKKKLFFNEFSELAYLLLMVSKDEFKHIPVDKILDDRINELLDLLLLSHSLHDELWVEDIRKRLIQITKQALSTSGL
jgi:hypothetical protein